jgi:hypothetical protein
MAATLVVLESDRRIEFVFDDLMKYHGPGSPGGVAHAFKVMERAFPLLDPEAAPERRAIAIRTAFGGPGARDGFEAVTRAVTGDRYDVDPGLARPELGRARERFVFELRLGDRAVTLVLRDGFVTEEFLDLARREQRSPEEEAHLDELKRQMAERLTAHRADEVYDVD